MQSRRILRDVPRKRKQPAGDDYYQSLLENTSDVIVLVDAAGNVGYINPAVSEVLGYRPEAWLGRSAFEFVHPEDAAACVSFLRSIASGYSSDGAQSTGLRVRSAAGAWRVLEVRAINRLAHPKVRGIILSARDVTDRRLVEKARKQLTALLDTTPDYVTTADPQGRTLYINEAARGLLRPAELERIDSHHLADLYPAWANRIISTEAIPTAVSTGFWKGELAVLNSQGQEVPVSQVILAHRNGSGAVEFLSSSARDISESKRAEAALRESEERFRQVAENIEEVFWLIDCQQWRLLYVSPAYQKVWGRDCAELYENLAAVLDHVRADDGEEEFRTVEQLFLGSSEREFQIAKPDGSTRWIRLRMFPVRDSAGTPYRVAGVCEDVTEQKQGEARLLRAALYDTLTSLPNRAALLDRLRRELTRCEHNPDTGFSILFLDVDRFKLINDSLGHTKGDALLVAISRRLEECLRPVDMVARLGGDEFVVMLHETVNIADVARVARRILAALNTPVQLGEHEAFITSSMGIVPSTGYHRAEDLLRDGDIAMYRAKGAGGARYEVFDAEMHAQAVARMQIETDLRRAVDRGEFRVHYQPIISLATGRISGFEALVRWQHPERGMIPPGDFIGVAEETGMILRIDWWVLHEACEQLRRWSTRYVELGDLTMSVNLSGKQFAHPGLVAKIVEILEQTGTDPRQVKLEVTEGVIVENTRAASAALAEMKQLGLQLQMDDFGTGYSSLSYLHRFPIDAVKVDRSFVGMIGPDGEGGEIVQTVAALGRHLSMDVIAEGVETRAQLEFLRSLGCGYAQGYLFSRPVSAESAEQLLRQMPTW